MAIDYSNNQVSQQRNSIDYLFFAVKLSVAVLAVTPLFLLTYYTIQNGVSPSDLFEESVGYRYFHSLRIVYSDETPWLPQGHLAGLVHQLIQHILSFKYEIDELTPRIDAFVLVNAAFVYVLSIAAFLFVCSSARPTYRWFFTPVLLWLTFFSLRLPGGWTVMPDYHVYLLPLALICIGICLNAINDDSPPLSVKNVIILAILTGCAVSLKPTFAIFPMAVGLYLALIDRRWKRAMIAGAFVLIVGVLLYITLVATYFRFDVAAITNYFERLIYFIKTQSSTLDSSEGQSFLGPNAWPVNWYDITALAVPAALLSCMGLIFRRREIVALIGFLPSFLLLIDFVNKRYYSHSLIELNAFIFVFILVAGAAVAKYIPVNGRLKVALVAVVFLSAATGALIGPATVVAQETYQVMEKASISSRQLSSILANAEGRTAILIPSNRYRPNSLHSAICKGGTSIFEPVWGVSPFSTALFPELSCIYYPRELHTYRFKSIVFTRSHNEPFEAAWSRMKKVYGDELPSCIQPEEVKSGPSVLIFCKSFLSYIDLNALNKIDPDMRLEATNLIGNLNKITEIIKGNSAIYSNLDSGNYSAITSIDPTIVFPAGRIYQSEGGFRIDLEGISGPVCVALYLLISETDALKVGVENRSEGWRTARTAPRMTADCASGDLNKVNLKY